MVTGKFGLMVRVMGTSQPQPLEVQANFICREIIKMNPKSYTSRAHAVPALKDSTEIQFVEDMAFQIQDHRTALEELKNAPEGNQQAAESLKFLFSESMDAWILDLDIEIKKLQS